LIVLFSRVLRGLGGSLRKIGAFVILVGLIAVISLVVAVPLWYFSSNFALGYSIFVIGLLAAGLLFTLVSRLVRLGREPDALRKYVNRRILPILKTAAVILATVGAIYGIALLVSRGHTAVAIVTSVFWVLLLGLLKYARRGKS
jgi:hypothetical protein